MSEIKSINEKADPVDEPGGEMAEGLHNGAEALEYWGSLKFDEEGNVVDE